MKRLDITLSQAIDEEFLRLCKVENVGQKYTKTEHVLGQGNTVPKMGDATWPQFNNHYLMVVPESEVAPIEHIITLLRREYPDEGVSCFISDCDVF